MRRRRTDFDRVPLQESVQQATSTSTRTIAASLAGIISLAAIMIISAVVVQSSPLAKPVKSAVAFVGTIGPTPEPTATPTEVPTPPTPSPPTTPNPTAIPTAPPTPTGAPTPAPPTLAPTPTAPTPAPTFDPFTSAWIYQVIGDTGSVVTHSAREVSEDNTITQLATASSVSSTSYAINITYDETIDRLSMSVDGTTTYFYSVSATMQPERCSALDQWIGFDIELYTVTLLYVTLSAITVAVDGGPTTDMYSAAMQSGNNATFRTVGVGNLEDGFTILATVEVYSPPANSYVRIGPVCDTTIVPSIAGVTVTDGFTFTAADIDSTVEYNDLTLSVGTTPVGVGSFAYSALSTYSFWMQYLAETDVLSFSFAAGARQFTVVDASQNLVDPTCQVEDLKHVRVDINNLDLARANSHITVQTLTVDIASGGSHNLHQADMASTTKDESTYVASPGFLDYSNGFNLSGTLQTGSVVPADISRNDLLVVVTVGCTFRPPAPTPAPPTPAPTSQAELKCGIADCSVTENCGTIAHSDYCRFQTATCFYDDANLECTKCPQCEFCNIATCQDVSVCAPIANVGNCNYQTTDCYYDIGTLACEICPVCSGTSVPTAAPTPVPPTPAPTQSFSAECNNPVCGDHDCNNIFNLHFCSSNSNDCYWDHEKIACVRCPQCEHCTVATCQAVDGCASVVNRNNCNYQTADCYWDPVQAECSICPVCGGTPAPPTPQPTPSYQAQCNNVECTDTDCSGIFNEGHCNTINSDCYWDHDQILCLQCPQCQYCNAASCSDVASCASAPNENDCNTVVYNDCYWDKEAGTCSICPVCSGTNVPTPAPTPTFQGECTGVTCTSDNCGNIANANLCNGNNNDCYYDYGDIQCRECPQCLGCVSGTCGNAANCGASFARDNCNFNQDGCFWNPDTISCEICPGCL